MGHRHNIAAGRLLTILLTALACHSTSFGTSSEMEQTLAAVEDCIAASPASWPPVWCNEYVEAIRDASTVSDEPSDYALRLSALREGFPLYWGVVNTMPDRPLFELQCAEIRWYARHLVTSVFPSEEDRRAVREQVTDLWQDAANSLMAQFTFLDPNVVRRAQADHLQRCLRWVDAPLKPIFQHPFTPDQMDRIREGWHELRYARVDLMRQLGGEEVFLTSVPQEERLSAHPHYLLTYRSLEQFEGFIWTLVAHPPADYAKAKQDYWKTQQRQQQRMLMARAQEQRLRTERSRQLHQTEYLSFLLAVVLESAQQLGSSQGREVLDDFHARVEGAPAKEVMPMR